MELFKYILPAIGTFVVGYLLWQLRRERLALEYEIIESEVFPKAADDGKYFIIKVKNIGNTALEDVSYAISLNKGSIDSVKFSNDKLINIDMPDDSSVNGKITLLNPDEGFQATLTISNADSSSEIDFQARGVGFTARPRTPSPSSNYYSFLITSTALLSVIIAIFSYFTAFNSSSDVELETLYKKHQESIKEFVVEIEETSKKRQKTIEELTAELDKTSKERQKKLDKDRQKRTQGYPEREQIIFSILNKSNLGTAMPDLLKHSGSSLTFWKTGLQLIHFYLEDTENYKNYVKALVSMAEVENIAPSSKGFLLYLAGKIEKEQENSNKAIEYFERCKHDTPLMYDHLMAQDPAYDLQKIKEKIVSN